MNVLLSIGDFSRMTFLSVKALRHYHDVALLEPATVDPVTGYRFYQPNQIATAHVIRRFRDLDMPLDEVRAILQAPNRDARNQAIVAHLERMERQLEQTQETVASLRMLLEGAQAPLEVRYRSEPLTPSFAIAERVRSADVVAWWMAAFSELHQALRSSNASRTGPDGALFSNDFFESEEGEVVAFVPAIGTPAPGRRVITYDVPAADLAVASHRGLFSDFDQTYGALGAWVAERALGAGGPIRERYLPLGSEDALLHHQTEVCWPTSRANGD
ncbi:MAG: MerR family transcriptional regulator [Mycobacteriales bacterium]